MTVKLHLIMPNAQKKSPVSREVTTANYRECFSLIRESALFEFAALQFMHDVSIEETIIETMFGKDYYFDSHKSNKLYIACMCTGYSDLPELLRELAEVESHWYTVGIFLKIAYFQLETIKNDTSGRSNQSTECLREMLATWLRGTDASPAALVQALRSAGMIGLAKRLAVKYGEKNLYMMHNF